ncbi:hypothetical protein Tel_17040 (plasmid) [Candidatus Tenderia electrophaga]|jgi:hypothetical protein|uniref:Uncharacterized protein n=1 Tax=Candidatus Tenderia electrophaga TaxID=1748243 RepID=A0A0S2TIP8_9GAMM|nr:hypothetical protein Tel_17040 [Candidatus Tenderia electrophaga]
MPAFNARLRPKELFGLPLQGVISGLVALASGFLALTFPLLPVKILLGLVALLAFGAMIVLFALGEELAFLRVRWLAKRERHAITYEAGRQHQ